MIEYFKKQLESASPLTHERLVEGLELRSGVYTSDQLQSYGDRQFNRIGQRELYLVVNREFDNPNIKREIIKCYEKDIEKFEECLEFVENNKTFPIFDVKDLQVYLNIKENLNK